MMLTNKVMKWRHILICVGKKAGGKLFAGDYNVGSSFFLSFFFKEVWKSQESTDAERWKRRPSPGANSHSG